MKSCLVEEMFASQPILIFSSLKLKGLQHNTRFELHTKRIWKVKELKNGVHWSGEQLPSEYRCLDVIVTQANFTACSKNKSGSPRRTYATNARDYFASPHAHHKNSNLLFKAPKLLHLGCCSGWQWINLHHLGFFNVHIDGRICAYKILQPKSGIEPAIFGVPVQRLGR